MKIRISVAVTVCLCFYLVACKSPSSSDSSNPVYPPQPGVWTASTGFGRLDFTVNSASTYIPTFTITYDNWRGVVSGSVVISQDPGWAISNRTFKIETTISGSRPEQWTIDGTFETSGKKASGNWKAVVSGQTDSGTWQAVPKS